MVNVKRYVGKTAREALTKVKAELGADAVVLSNRALEDGVEIVAMPANAMGELNATVKQARSQATQASEAAAKAAQAAEAARQSALRRNAAAAPPPSDDDDFTVSLGQQLARLAREDQANATSQASKLVSASERYRDGLSALPAAAKPAQHALQAPQVTPPAAPRPVRAQHQIPGLRAPASQAVNPAAESAREEFSPAAMTPEESADHARVIALQATNAQLMDELASLKGMVERQLSGFAWNEMSRTAPSRTQMMSELMEAGFSPQLTRRLTEEIEGAAPITEARKSVRTALNRNLRAISSDADIIDRGGVYALVGPTGVGKTTTTAKLAARCVVRHGADKLALITTDGYRIGAHEQLRIYGRILGVQVHIVRDAADLRQTLQDLRNKHMVLIDTIGMSQRDKMVVEQASMLHSAGNVRRLLCLNATASGETLEDVLKAYDGADLAGCILTKVDEAGALAPVIDVAARHELDVFYIANGQRVPEDLHLPNRNYLVHRALREIPADSPYKLNQAEAALRIAQDRSVPRGQDRRGAA